MALRASAHHAHRHHHAPMRRQRCPICHGFGTLAAGTPACAVCGEQWRQARFEAHLEAYDRGGWLSWLWPHGRNRYRWEVALPCGHPMVTALTYVTTQCLACRGVGTVAHFTLADTLTDTLIDTYVTRRMCLLPKRQESVGATHHYPPIAPIVSTQRTTPRLTIRSRRVW